MLAMRAGCRLGGLRVPAARALSGVRMVHATPMVLTNPELFPTGELKHVPATMIDEVLPIVIDDDYVLCNGGDDTLVGHPIEMIKVDSPWPAVCKYCGLRYINKDMAAKNADWAFLVGADPTGLPVYDGVAADSTRQPYSG